MSSVEVKIAEALFLWIMCDQENNIHTGKSEQIFIRRNWRTEEIQDRSDDCMKASMCH